MVGAQGPRGLYGPQALKGELLQGESASRIKQGPTNNFRTIITVQSNILWIRGLQ